MLTIFTAPKPFQGLIDVIQRNAIGSWKQIDPNVEIFLIGEEDGIAEAAEQMGVQHFPDVGKNEHGTPLVSSIFEIAREHSRHANLCFVNADIIFLDDLLESVERFSQKFDQFLVVGQRWDLAIDTLIRFENGWVEEARTRLRKSGRLHPPAVTVGRRLYPLSMPRTRSPSFIKITIMDICQAACRIMICLKANRMCDWLVVWKRFLP
jgi:hypothetical protein